MNTQTTPTTARAAFFSLAAAITFSLLGVVSLIADRQVADVQMAQATSAPLQVVVVTGHRLPRV